MFRSYLGDRTSWILSLSLATVMAGLLGGCITDATVDLTKAPFKASTDLTNGTTNALTDLTEPTRELLSSTTPGAWFTNDGTVRPQYKALAFTALNFENLRANMAEGQGEYLSSFAVLVGVPPERQATFFHEAQAAYPHIFAKGLSQRESFERLFKRFDIIPARLLKKS